MRATAKTTVIGGDSNTSDAIQRTSGEKPLPAVYALKAWSMRKSGDAWCIAPTACFGNKPAWSKPYSTLQGATSAIARRLAEEALARDKRRSEYQRLSR